MKENYLQLIKITLNNYATTYNFNNKIIDRYFTLITQKMLNSLINNPSIFFSLNLNDS